MKVIFSRKGFDGASGGVASPIFPNGRFCSLPIPDTRSTIRYDEIRCAVATAAPGASARAMGPLVEQLTSGRVSARHGAHLDPDLYAAALPRADGWRPLFGQAGAAQGHLARQGVGPGDLFLFYGWFRAVRSAEGRWCYVSAAPDVHMLFGWLQVDRTIALADGAMVPSWAAYHPHCYHSYSGNNTLYVAAERLRLPGCAVAAPGAGIFTRMSPRLQLTAPGCSRSIWRLPRWFLPTGERPALTYHADAGRWQPKDGHVRLRTVGRGQEFVFDTADYPESLVWIRKIFA